jgi:hypothetical protein
MKSLAISPDLSLAIYAATQTFAFVARKGTVKTYAAGKLTELLLDAGVQVVVLDTVGNCQKKHGPDAAGGPGDFEADRRRALGVFQPPLVPRT